MVSVDLPAALLPRALAQGALCTSSTCIRLYKCHVSRAPGNSTLSFWLIWPLLAERSRGSESTRRPGIVLTVFLLSGAGSALLILQGEETSRAASAAYISEKKTRRLSVCT